MSVVSKRFKQQVGQRPFSSLRGKRLLGATGQPLQTIGEVTLRVELGSQVLQHQFSVVKDFPYPVLFHLPLLISSLHGHVTLSAADQ